MILALDTATRQAGLALYDGDSVRVEHVWRTTEKHHTEWLVPAIEKALAQATITAQELKAVAVTKGPGSYTGLRVALSVAKGLVVALNIPIIGVNSLDALAFPFLQNEGQQVLAAIALGRGRFAYHFYMVTGAKALSEYHAPDIVPIGNVQTISAELERLYPRTHIKVVGEFTPEERYQFGGDQNRFIEFVPNALALRRPAVVAQLASFRLQDGDHDDPHTLEPIYLQPST